MTAPANQTTPPATATKPASAKPQKSDFEILMEKDVKSLTWYQPYGADEGYTIPLSVKLIRDYIAVPAWDKEAQKEVYPSDEECFKFIALCKARRLNPYEGDAYMIPFWDGTSRKHKWNLITSHNAFLKRAELHQSYDGMDSGIIVLNGDKIVEREGDFEWPGDTLMGGWSIVYVKGRSHPKKSKVKLSTYKKGFGVWLNDPAGMICKVAEAHSVRDSFPTIIGGMLIREEVDIETVPNATKKPAFTHDGIEMLRKVNEGKAIEIVRDIAPVSPPSEKQPEPEPEPGTNGGQPPPPPAPEPGPAEPPVTQPEPAPAATGGQVMGVPEPTETTEQKIKRMANTILELGKAAGYTKEQTIEYLKKYKWMNPASTQVVEIAERKLEALLNAWQAKPTPELAADIKSKMEKK